MTRRSRREFIKAGSTTVLAALLQDRFISKGFGFANADEKLPVAAIVTIYTPNSHTDVIVGKILEGYQQNGGAGPDLRLVSMYTDQVPEKDLSRAMAGKHGFQISKSIDEAITGGTNQIQVAGVLSIGEHGNYPLTPDTKQQMYPRRRFFDEIVATFRRCGKSVPVFNDKHLSYRWEDARYMVDTAASMKFPLLAGSSVPLGWRKPVLELPRGCEIESALTIGYSGFEVYGFHALEAHQCMIERRRGGETGVTAVQAVTGDAILETKSKGRWSGELFAAALKQLPGPPHDTGGWIKNKQASVYLLEHRDGLNSAVVMANGLAAGFAFAVKLKGQTEPLATYFQLQEGAPFGHFAYLLHAIDRTIHTGKAAYPVERTLLTTGILDRIMHSLAKDGERLETPELTISYEAANWPFANSPDSVMSLPSD